jgi:hypothetical protein
MEDPREERLARNEAFFREVNERIMDVAAHLGDDDHVYEFLCECPDPNCAQRLSLTVREYEDVRSDATRFVVVPGHIAPAAERVVEREAEHDVVEKHGRAGEVAAELDPRAA